MTQRMASKKPRSAVDDEKSECTSTCGDVVDCKVLLSGDSSKESDLHFVYIVKCADDSLYCGWTTNLKHRMEAHNGIIPGGAKYTRGRRPVQLVYAESFHEKQAAQRREYAIKRMSKTQKLRLLKDTN
ncbi:GIY-YIG nuclease superfamily protein [Veillonella rodentium]|uniref:GIY-YIG nuclease superfamily protein n=2 Tax=Veillonella rodentium TaxID=248315 RepID=A0A239ZT11_9FIRM|nr:GIY-YIG nuclease superfamily protein [Veillonella rodentium]